MISPRLNWRLLLGEFVVIVVGVLMALWVDELREARYNSALEIEYLQSFVTDLEADLAQFDETEAWMRRSEAAAATVLALYKGSPPTENPADLVMAVETAGWQSWPVITRNTIDDLRSTGNLRLIRDRSCDGRSLPITRLSKTSSFPRQICAIVYGKGMTPAFNMYWGPVSGWPFCSDRKASDAASRRTLSMPPRHLQLRS